MSFEGVCEGGMLAYDSSRGEAVEVRRGAESQTLEFDGTIGDAPEINYFAECVASQQAPTRATPHGSRLATRIALDELRQIGF